MNDYIVTHAANDAERVVLISDAEASASQRQHALQTIKAENWVAARCKVNTVCIYHDEGFGWRF